MNRRQFIASLALLNLMGPQFLKYQKTHTFLGLPRNHGDLKLIRSVRVHDNWGNPLIVDRWQVWEHKKP